MNELTTRDLELVALGAALGSNCASCVDYHVGAARKAGLSDAQIRAAITTADRIRQVPARKAFEAAETALAQDAPAPGAATQSCGCAGIMATACGAR